MFTWSKGWRPRRYSSHAGAPPPAEASPGRRQRAAAGMAPTPSAERNRPVAIFPTRDAIRAAAQPLST